MRWNSIRVRLTLWYVGVFALILAALGLTLTRTLHTRLAAAADRELLGRVQQTQEIWNDSERRWRGPRRTRRQPRSNGGPILTEAERQSFFRRPRFFDTQQRPLGRFIDDTPWDEEAFWLAVGGQTRFSRLVYEGEPLRVISAPLWRNGDVDGVVQVAYPLGEQQRLESGLERTLLTLLPVALVVAALGGIFLTDRALGPVRRITNVAAQIGAEDLSRRLDVRGKDELADLAATFNGMIERLESAFRRLEEGYEQQRRFTADASHELRTPLARVKASTSLALSGQRTAAEYRKALEVADHGADTIGRLIQDLLLLARADAGQLQLQLQRTPIETVLRDAVAMAPDARRELFRWNLDDRLAVSGHPDSLRRLFSNLIENALRHLSPDGTITLSARAAGDEVVVEVTDEGEGIAPEHLPHLGERFYRVDASRARNRGGSGLGLAICQSIAHAHGGSLSIASELGRGTTVTVRLPRASGPRQESIKGPRLETVARL